MAEAFVVATNGEDARALDTQAARLAAE